MNFFSRLKGWLQNKNAGSLSPHTMIVFGPYKGLNEDLFEAVSGTRFDALSMTVHGAQHFDAIVSSELSRMSPPLFEPCLVMCCWPLSDGTNKAIGARGDAVFEAIKVEWDRIRFRPASFPEMQLLVDEARKLLGYSFIFPRLTK